MGAAPNLLELCLWWREAGNGMEQTQDWGHRAHCKKMYAAAKLALYREIERLERQGGMTDDDITVRHGDERAPPGA